MWTVKILISYWKRAPNVASILGIKFVVLEADYYLSHTQKKLVSTRQFKIAAS